MVSLDVGLLEYLLRSFHGNSL